MKHQTLVLGFLYLLSAPLLFVAAYWFRSYGWNPPDFYVYFQLLKSLGILFYVPPAYFVLKGLYLLVATRIDKRFPLPVFMTRRILFFSFIVPQIVGFIHFSSKHFPKLMGIEINWLTIILIVWLKMYAVLVLAIAVLSLILFSATRFRSVGKTESATFILVILLYALGWYATIDVRVRVEQYRIEFAMGQQFSEKFRGILNNLPLHSSLKSFNDTCIGLVKQFPDYVPPQNFPASCGLPLYINRTASSSMCGKSMVTYGSTLVFIDNALVYKQIPHETHGQNGRSVYVRQYDHEVITKDTMQGSNWFFACGKETAVHSDPSFYPDVREIPYP